MKIEYTLHAQKRMSEFNISKDLIESIISSPDSILDGDFGRKIFQRKTNGQLFRIIVEMEEGIKRVITLYPARSTRYEI